MAVKNTVHTFQKMNKDITESKNPIQFYYDAHNIRFITNKEVTSGGFSFEKGNDLKVTIPEPKINASLNRIEYIVNGNIESIEYSLNNNVTQPRNEIEEAYFISNNNYRSSSTQTILGHSVLRDKIIIFSTDNNGFDCIWKIDDDYNISLLYLRNLQFSTNNPIWVVNNFENSNIDKIYWIDEKSQMRFINTNHSIENEDLEELIDLPSNAIEMVGTFSLSQPIVKEILTGGIHTAGMIQYAYNLYRINSSQTKLSPFSELVALDKGILGGGELNEIVAQTPLVNITNIDENFTHIKVYAIKYTSYNQLPSISLIDEREIPTSRNIEIFDDGNIIESVSLEEFLFTGSEVIIPKNINSKDGRMFFASYKEINFDVDLDMRAYSFNNSNKATVYDNLFFDGTNVNGVAFDVDGTNYDDPLLTKFDSVNLDYDNFKYQFNTNIIGGEGKHLKYELTQDITKTPDSKFFKDDEIYRIGIQFYNRYGQLSLPKWIADFRSREGNLRGLYNTLKITLKPEFYIWLNNPSNFPTEFDIPIGYKILVAERNFNDKTIVANGLVSTMMVNNKIPNRSDNLQYKRDISETLPKTPTFFIRNLASNANSSDAVLQNTNVPPVRNAWHMHRLDIADSPASEVVVDKHTAQFYQFNSMLQLYSPETVFNQQFSLTAGLSLKVKGAFKNTYNAGWGTEYQLDLLTNVTEAKTIGGISPHFTTGYVIPIIGNAYALYDSGQISHPGGDNANIMARDQYYRVFGSTDLSSVSSGYITTFTNNLTPVTTSSGNVSLISLKKGVQIILNENNNPASSNLTYKGKIRFTITPNGGFMGVNYNASIISDPLGSEYVSVSNVSGIQVLDFEQEYEVIIDSDDNTFDFISYLNINPDANFQATVNIYVYYEEVDNSTSTQTKFEEYNSNINPVDIQINNTIITSTLVTPVNPITEEIYGIPEVTERGQDYTSYNNDSRYRYFNSLESTLTDGAVHTSDGDLYSDTGLCERRIVSVNAWGNRAITLVTGSDNPSVRHWQRKPLEQLLIDSGINGNNYGLICELVKSKEEIYMGNIYGGNSYEDKKRSNYIEIGEYKNININTINIKSPGDTFVDNFRFERVMKTDTDISNQCVQQITEIVEFTTETTVDLKNRNDLSLQEWDTKFSPKFEDFHKYNRVYSQTPNLVLRRDLNFNFKKVTNFDTNVIASKLKTPNELIDSWTDIQQNEILTMDGKYGSIHGLIGFKDELFTFQDRGIAFLSINPRVQVQGTDGFQIELGKGAVLNEYKYITSNSGSINKWGIQTTESGIYYLDALNKSFNLVQGQSILGLSDKEGFHKYFLDNINSDIMKQDNPILYRGCSIGWDKITNDVYLSIFEEGNYRTLAYNLTQGGFSSFYDYHSSMYIYSKSKLFTVNPNQRNQLFENFTGNYNVFYNQTKQSRISFILNPEPYTECTFNNLEYKSEAFDELNNNEDVNYTWERIRAYNEFQDSNLVTLNNNFNIRKLNRKWRINIPRDNKLKTNRIRNTWSIITLESDNLNNYNYRNHDIIAYYTPNNKTFN